MAYPTRSRTVSQSDPDRGEPMSKSAVNRVLLIVKHPGNARVLEQAVAEIELTGIGVSSEIDLREELEREDGARAALVDVSGFGRAVWALCELLQQYEVRFVVLSTAGEREVGNRSLAYGATSVQEKPVAKRALLQLMRNLIER